MTVRQLDPSKHPCLCVRAHAPKPESTDSHHVIPIYLGGAQNGEQVPLCSTTHQNLHRILSGFLDAGRVTPRGHHNPYAYALAVRAFNERPAKASRWVFLRGITNR